MIQTILNLKTSFDKALHEVGIDRTVFDKYKDKKREFDDHKIVNAKSFMRMILPFSDVSYDTRNNHILSVPSQNVLGGWYKPESEPIFINDNAAHQKATELDQSVTNPAGEPAYYTEIEINGYLFYIPHEGKNRVSLYRRLNRNIVASILKTSYPQPSELELVKLWPSTYVGLRYKGNDLGVCSRVEYWQCNIECSSDNELQRTFQCLECFRNHKIAILPFNESVAIFEKYGVQYSKMPVFSMKAKNIAMEAKLYVANNFYSL